MSISKGRWRPPKRKWRPLGLYVFVAIIVAGLTLKYLVLAPAPVIGASMTKNGELTYSSQSERLMPASFEGKSNKTPSPGEIQVGDDSGRAPPKGGGESGSDGGRSTGAKDSKEEEVEPASYKEEGSFAGGKVEEGLVISGIRFGKHKDFRRVVIDFGVPEGGDTASIRPSNALPKYLVTYNSSPFRFTVTFQGVRYSEGAHIQKKNSLPFSLITDESGAIKQLEFFITRPAVFKVIEVDDPARLALDIKYLTKSDVQRVQVVQVIGVESVERAFELVESGTFPESFDPQVIALGEQFFIEGIFSTFEDAVKVAGELEESGYSTIISERKESAFPVEK